MVAVQPTKEDDRTLIQKTAKDSDDKISVATPPPENKLV
jgi:hypothetical protein